MSRSILGLSFLWLTACGASFSPDDPIVFEDADLDGVSAAEDCDDSDPTVYPGAPELCDAKDNDCDDLTDDLDELAPGEGAVFYVDKDGDGVGSVALDGPLCEAPAGTSVDDGDCDDGDALVFPGAPELCDGIDNDCDKAVDDDDPEGVAAESAGSFYPDLDGDGFGDDANVVLACIQPAGLLDVGGDCDDAEPLAWRDAPELCDGVDNDCDGLTDDEDTVDDPDGVSTFYADGDGDGAGTPLMFETACEAPEGYVASGDDCDDNADTVYPGAPEICDGQDNNCDPLFLVDLDDPEAVGFVTYWPDTDGDGFGTGSGTDTCDPPPFGSALVGGDCAPLNGAIFPGATYYGDGDADGFGDAADAVTPPDCGVPAGYVANDDDCEPTVGEIYPGASYPEDGDGDGFGDPVLTVTSTGCGVPSGASLQANDCDDGDADIYPGALEVCDGEDNDCDTDIDETDAWWNDAWPYRVLVDVTLPAGSPGLPVDPVIDFEAALAALGDASGLAVDSIRVVEQDCSEVSPEIPFQFEDGFSNLLDGPLIDDPLGDDAGVVAFTARAAGLPSVLGAQTRAYGVYFGSNANASTVPAPVFSTGLSVSVDSNERTLANDLVTAVFDDDQGGLLVSYQPSGGPVLASQTASGPGNGIHAGGWESMADDVADSVSLIVDGPVVAVLRADSTRVTSSLDVVARYEHVLFHDRAELYTHTRFVLDGQSTLGPQNSGWDSGVRPIQSDAPYFAAGGTAYSDAGFNWVAADKGAMAWGVALGWRDGSAPDFVEYSLTATNGRFLALSGVDVMPDGQFSATFAAGTELVGGSTAVTLGFESTWGDNQDAFEDIAEGGSTAVGGVEAAAP